METSSRDVTIRLGFDVPMCEACSKNGFIKMNRIKLPIFYHFANKLAILYSLIICKKKREKVENDITRIKNDINIV